MCSKYGDSMNDFTKEELERILEGVSWWLDGDDSLYSEELIDKIETMIETYEAKVIEAWHCEKCGHVQ